MVMKIHLRRTGCAPDGQRPGKSRNSPDRPRLIQIDREPLVGLQSAKRLAGTRDSPGCNVTQCPPRTANQQRPTARNRGGAECLVKREALALIFPTLGFQLAECAGTRLEFHCSLGNLSSLPDFWSIEDPVAPSGARPAEVYFRDHYSQLLTHLYDYWAIIHKY